ncbi:MAG: ABC transporter ATP-binding protein [Microbacterium sp.]
MDEPIALVTAENARRVFEPGEQGVKSATFTIEANTSVAIVGPSGSGKTTLLSMLGMLETPTAGKLDILGRDALSVTPRAVAHARRAEISFIFQAFHLVPHLTVEENVTLGLHHHDGGAAAWRARVGEHLAALGLTNHTGAYPRTLSGGEQQRVAIARALVREPRLLLCDEPTGNLDSANGAIVVDALLSSVSPSTAVVIVTHDEDLAARCMRRIRVRDGLAESVAS